ncbi:omega-6 fatty acid desaturase (delta-12 desaturase) [Roseovarius azorensis]|uniref:Omega-6 fatty acid desaturase (Delta-12 desaturase) n=1 Tax=Roseovarius azorensis TaxID=1287727 RepID=A0A1H7HM31_9RHOB|nr:fatty acid desaturase [Roseovarius azorensis]SEK49275.1 omega-6 fatty acid desaturase (delta-12 desaturase) [Roseovarius azorensis]
MTETAAETSLRTFLKPYTAKSDLRGALSLAGTLAVYAGALILGAHWAGQGVALAALPMIVILAFASVRLYVLQHDCGHLSLFATRWPNEAAGHVLSVFSLTPFRVMQYNHNQHHAYLGNLDHRETTEVYTMTLREWQSAPWLRRLWYRTYRNPAVMLSLGGIYTYFIAYRWPRNTLKVGVAGVIVHNLMLAGYLWLVWVMLGMPGLIVLGASAVIAGVIGVFLVYLQHNFEETYWDRKPDLDFRKATLVGSSSLDLGWLWDLGTGNIAYHDLHHYNPGIPSYNLRRCQNDLPEALKSHDVIRWPEAIRSFRLKLWDEDTGRLVPFPTEESAHAVTAR